MRLRHRLPLAAALAGLLAAAATAADVTTVTGKKLAGELVAVEPAGITLKTDGGEVKVAAKELLLVDLGNKVQPPGGDAKWSEVELTDGSVIRCARFSLKGKAFDLEPLPGPEGVPPPVTEVPMRSVFSAMRGAEVQKNRDDWKAMLQSRGKRDLYVTRQAEGLTFVQGTIVEGDAEGKRLTFEREDGQKVDLLQSRATGGLVLNPTAVGQPPKTLCKVIDVFGNTLFAQAVTMATGGVEVKTVSGAVVKYKTAAAVAKLDFAKGNIAYLSDMDLRTDAPPVPPGEDKFPDGTDKLTAGPPAVIRDRYAFNEPIRLDKTTFPKGLTVAAGTTLAAPLNGEYREFKAVVGFQSPEADAAGGSGVRDANREVKLTIEADGRNVFAETVSLKDKPREVTLDVKGVKRLTITVEAADPTAERVVLADARVQK
jgi:hypothetical protein